METNMSENQNDNSPAGSDEAAIEEEIRDRAESPSDDTPPGGTLAPALNYQAQGQLPVPACWEEPCQIPWHLKDGPCHGKRPLVDRVGLDGRTSVSVEEVQEWWRRWPLAQLALLTGARSNRVVVDLDGEEGEANWKKIEDEFGPFAPTLEVRTKHGRHLYFLHPGGVKILTRKGSDFYPFGRDAGPVKGVDVRGDGGLVVAPPSRNREYANDLEPVELPAALVEPLSTGSSEDALPAEEYAEALELIRTEGEPCPCAERILERYPEAGKNRHQALIHAQRALVGFGREQHPGAGQALDRLQAEAGADSAEWVHALEGAVAIAVAEEPKSVGCGYKVVTLAKAGAETEPLTVAVVKGGRITDYPQRLIMFTPTEVQEKVETKHGTKTAVLTDAVVLDGEGAPIKLPGLQLTQVYLVGSLRKEVGGKAPVLAVLIQDEGKDGQQGAWKLDSDRVTEAQVNLAAAYLDHEEAGTLKVVKVKAEKKVDTDDRFTDSRLAIRVAEEVMADRYIWVPGLRWMTWDGKRWISSEEETIREGVMNWVIGQFDKVIDVAREKSRTPDWEEIEGWKKAQSRHRITAIADLTKGIVLVRAHELDADPDLLNTPAGVVDMRTGQVRKHDPDLLMTGMSSGSYIPGYTHPDWEQALGAVPEKVREWFQTRSGQAATGHPVQDDLTVIFQGSGANGKTSVTSKGPVPALGSYGSVASHKLFAKGSEHSTERADLRGRRYVVAEELTEGRSIDITALKQIQGTGRIKARFLYEDNIEFEPSHTLFVTTNYVPIVAEVDHGTWRRLALVRFPFTFRTEGEELSGKRDKAGDLGLRDRIKDGKDGQHDAIVTWLVEGAMRWYADPSAALAQPQRVRKDTRDWQMDADRILGFWDELLEPAEDVAIVTAELLNVFNAWVEGNGHHAWPKETFHPRFSQHMETARHRVQKKRPSTVPELSRPARHVDQVDPLPGRPEVYAGVRFRKSEAEAEARKKLATKKDEQDNRGRGQTRQTPGKTPLRRPFSESLSDGLSGLSTPLTSNDGAAVDLHPFTDWLVQQTGHTDPLIQAVATDASKDPDLPNIMWPRDLYDYLRKNRAVPEAYKGLERAIAEYEATEEGSAA
jgi:P4 family phage/plasmid primase-like protien